jgi:2-C-methyl-D-erythritol 4-phosphate cytidylyltransferase
MTLALILAAGSGERLGAEHPKALVALAGRPMLAWSVEALSRVEGVERIVLALPPGTGTADGEGCEAPGGIGGLIGPGGPELRFVSGGSARSESVLKALESAPEGDPVLIHDAARPLVSTELAGAAIAALLADDDADGAIAAVPVTDTIKRVGHDGSVIETLERSELWAVQTPQVFRRAALERALAAGASELARATDDAWLVERLGGRVVIVASSPRNLKVTTALDLELAERMLGQRAGHMPERA